MSEPDGTVPCGTCERLTVFTKTKRCHSCWTVELMLPDYLRSENGRRFAAQALAEAEAPKI